MLENQLADCIILLDDVPMHSTIADRMLHHFQLTMPRHVFTSAVDALDFLEQRGEELPGRVLLLVDLLMPEMSGLEFADRMQDLPESLLQRCRLIMVSSTIDDRDLHAITQHALIERFMPKPLNGEDLRALLKANPPAGKWGS